MENQPSAYYVVWLPFLAALFGAGIGSLTSLLTMMVRTRAERRRERLRLAVEAGLADFRQQIEIAQRTQGTHQVSPLSSYIYYHAGLLDLLDSGVMNRKSVMELDRQQSEFLKAVQDAEVKDPRTSSGGRVQGEKNHDQE